MTRRLALYLLPLALLCAGLARAQEPAVITVKKTGGQVDLNLVPLAGADGAVANKALVDDLNLSGSINLSAGAAAGTPPKARPAAAACKGRSPTAAAWCGSTRCTPAARARRPISLPMTSCSR